MKDSDKDVIAGAMRKIRAGFDDVREVRLDPDAALDEGESDNLLMAEQEIDGALLALHSALGEE